MGSFDITCSVSGLPIGYGDEVRTLLLTQNPYNRGKKAGAWTHSSNDVWFPRTFPLKGVYDDYGRIKLTTTGIQSTAWLKCLTLDVLEKGWGENSVHDVAVRKRELTHELIDSAITSGRLHVKQAEDIDFLAVPRLIDPEAVKGVEKILAKTKEGHRDPAPKLPPGVPTRRRIEQMLTAAGYRLHAGAHDDTEVLVNRVDAITVRVRMAGFGKGAANLEKVKVIIEPRFAVMLTVGTGSYCNDAELLIRPYPQAQTEDRAPLTGTKPGKPLLRRERSLAVARAVIREDVWQAIAQDTVRTCWDGTYSIAKYRKIASELLKKAPKKSPSEAAPLLADMWGFDNALAHSFRELPFCVGLETHWKYITEAMVHAKAPKAEVAEFLQTAAEMAFLSTYLLFQRYQWRPTSSCGPQHGEWGPHASFYAAMAKITAAHHKKQIDDYKRDM